MKKEIIEELLSYFETAADIRILREGLHAVVWEYLELNIDTGVDKTVNGVFLKHFNNLLEVLCILENDQRRISKD